MAARAAARRAKRVTLAVADAGAARKAPSFLEIKDDAMAIISEVMDNKGKGEMDTVDDTELDF